MKRSRHARRRSFVPTSPARCAVATVGVWSVVATTAGNEPRYARVVDLVLGLVLVALGALPAEYHRRARAAVLGVTTAFFALAGVVAAASMDEAMTLVAGAIVAGIMARFFSGIPRRPSHAASGT